MDEVLVDVVREDPDPPVRRKNPRDGREPVGGADGAGRVVGEVQHHPARALADGLPECRGIETEAVALVAPDVDGDAAQGGGDQRVAGPVGRRDDHLVAGLEGRREGVVDRLLGAVGDDDLVLVDVEAVVACELAPDRAAAGAGARDLGVFGLAALGCVAGGLDDVRRRVEVGFADRERQDVVTLGP